MTTWHRYFNISQDTDRDTVQIPLFKGKLALVLTQEASAPEGAPRPLQSGAEDLPQEREPGRATSPFPSRWLITVAAAATGPGTGTGPLLGPVVGLTLNSHTNPPHGRWHPPHLLKAEGCWRGGAACPGRPGPRACTGTTAHSMSLEGVRVLWEWWQRGGGSSSSVCGESQDLKQGENLSPRLLGQWLHLSGPQFPYLSNVDCDNTT